MNDDVSEDEELGKAAAPVLLPKRGQPVKRPWVWLVLMAIPIVLGIVVGLARSGGQDQPEQLERPRAVAPDSSSAQESPALRRRMIR